MALAIFDRDGNAPAFTEHFHKLLARAVRGARASGMGLALRPRISESARPVWCWRQGVARRGLLCNSGAGQ